MCIIPEFKLPCCCSIVHGCLLSHSLQGLSSQHHVYSFPNRDGPPLNCMVYDKETLFQTWFLIETFSMM